MTLVDSARLGTEHPVTLASPESLAEGGFAVPRRIPHKPDVDESTWSWCHGPAGTLALFEALHDADAASVAREPPSSWVVRCVPSLPTSAIPERRHPGFWDNDGRCCSTAGVGSAVLPHDRDFCRFIEHRNPDPLLPPGVGWVLGAAGVAGFLFEGAA